MQKRVLLLTGMPGVGKTTAVMKTVQALKAEGFRVGGMISREVREGDVRIGFEILDVSNIKHGWLAHVNQEFGPKIGKYHVNIEDLNAVGAQAIFSAVEKSDLIVIDEVGPMELLSEMFKQAVHEALESRKPVLAVVHFKAKNPLITTARSRPDSELYTVTLENRDNLPEELAKKVLAFKR